MPIKKLPDPPGWVHGMPCRHPEHELPKHMVFRPGRYEHTCPGCGKKTEFTVTGPVL